MAAFPVFLWIAVFVPSICPESQIWYYHRKTANRLFADFRCVCRSKKLIATPSVRFLHVAQFSLQAQRRSGFRPSCQNVHGAASVAIRPWCRMSLTALTGHWPPYQMLRRGPSLLPFVQSAAFCWLKRLSADFVTFRCGCANVGFGEAVQQTVLFERSSWAGGLTKVNEKQSNVRFGANAPRRDHRAKGRAVDRDMLI
jgi:hypothetical protein